jgi:membrane protein DedA with SNARE-associated domain
MEQIISDLFSQYAYSPWLVYGGICLFMLLSAFGLPIPEEVVLISAGFVGYASLNPDKFPPPTPDAEGVNVYLLAAVAFFAVMGADFLIYWLGKVFGPRMFKMRFFSRLVSEEALNKIQNWTKKYGYWAVLIFRFTPGVRFPGHLMCGAMGMSPWRFIAVDSLAAGISVPTQVLLVSFYGEFILQYFTRFKLVLFSLFGAALIGFVLWKFLQKRKTVPEEVIKTAVGE